jgi:hypothetical protein
MVDVPRAFAKIGPIIDGEDDNVTKAGFPFVKLGAEASAS